MLLHYKFDNEIYHTGVPYGIFKVGGAWYRYNKFGFRDKPRKLKKPKNTYRVALIGDSFVEGYECQFDYIAGRALQRRVDDNSFVKRLLKHSPYENIEVLSFGQGGFNPTLYWKMLESYVLKFNPDIVYVNVFTFNDIAGMVPFQDYSAEGTPRCGHNDYYDIDEKGELVLSKSYLSEHRKFLREKKSFLKAIRRKLSFEKSKSESVSKYKYYSNVLFQGLFAYAINDVETRKAYDLTAAVLKKMKDLCDRHHAQMVVVNLCNADVIDPELLAKELLYYNKFKEEMPEYPYNLDTLDPLLPGRELRQAAESIHAEFLDLNDYIKTDHPRETFKDIFYYYDSVAADSYIKCGHYNKNGNWIWAGMLEKHLTSHFKTHISRCQAADGGSDSYSPFNYTLY